MAITLRHTTTTTKPNNPAVDVSKTAWEKDHAISGGTNKGDQLIYDPSEITGLNIRAARQIDVRDYGAVGDGVTDDTAAFKAAIAAAGYASVYNQPLTGLHNVGRGAIVIPKGVFKITDSLNYASGLNFIGVGVNSEILFQPTSLKSLFVPGTNYFYDTTPFSHAYINMRDMMIWGLGSFAQDGIYFNGVSFFVLDNITVAGFVRYGIFVGDTNVVGAYYNQINHAHLLNNGVNLHVDTGANSLFMNGGRIRNTVAGSDYLVELNAISSTFNGVSFEGDAAIALIHDQGVGTSILNYYEENNNSGVFIKRDATKNYISGLTLCGGSRVDKLVLYENFDLTALQDTHGADADNLGLGSPIPVPVVVNGEFRKGLYGWTHYGGVDDVETVDTTTIFCAPNSIKMTHAANTNAAGIYQDIDLTAYQGKQLHATILVNFTGVDYPTLKVELDAFARSKQLYPIIDYGNGWQLWEASFIATSASARLTLGFAKSSAICYLALCQVWIGGIPQIPTEVFKDEVFKAAAAPASGTWVVGDVVWNSSAALGAAPGWVYTAAGFKAMSNLV